MRVCIAAVCAGLVASAAWAQVPLPREAETVAAIARQMPAALANSCQNTGGSWAFMDAVVDTLKAKDARWGYNGKRGNVDDPSHDAIAYHYGSGTREASTEVYIIDVIGGHCGSDPSTAWIDQTRATREAGTIGRYVGCRRGRDCTSPAPTPTPTPTPTPETGPDHQALMTRIGALEGEIKALRATLAEFAPTVLATAASAQTAVERADEIKALLEALPSTPIVVAWPEYKTRIFGQSVTLRPEGQ